MSLTPKAKNVAERLAGGQSPKVVQRVLSLSSEQYNELVNSSEFAHFFDALLASQREKIGDTAKRYAKTAFRTGRRQRGLL